MIVIPMAGLSSRFTKAGYTVPKYMLEAHGKSLFRHAVESFSRYFFDTPFLFILRDVQGTRDFVVSECEAMGINDARIIALDCPTRGQAETVYLGLQGADVGDDESLTIFNIDSLRPGFVHPDWSGESDGYLEVFQGEGEHWSFAEPDPENEGRVLRTTEKVRISDLCSNGLYYFSRASDFIEVVNIHSAKSDDELQAGELYVAPMYNDLIAKGMDIRFRLVGSDAVLFSGTPDEYVQFKAAPLPATEV